MKKKTGRWIRQYRVAGVLFALGVLALIVYGSFAAYTSFNSVKRVVSTGTQSDTMFSSNYLSLLDLGDETYPVRRISPAESGGNCTFTVLVCNYVWGDESLYNPKDITYTVTAQLFSMDGGELPEGIANIKVNGESFNNKGVCSLDTQQLAAGSARSNSYRVEMPSDLKNKIKIQIVAKPNGDASIEAVNSKQLAAVLSFAEYEAVKNWAGHFLDSKTKDPDDYDAFNYEISGNGAGTVTVTWPDSLQMSKWATDGTQVSSPYTFKVDDTTATIQFQFYRNPDQLSDLTGKSWTELEKLITVKFEESQATRSSGR